MSKKIDKELSSEELLEKKLDVIIHKNSLSDIGGYYVKVKCQTASVKAVLSRIKAKDKGIDIVSLKHGLEMVNNEIISLLSEGYSVKVLDLGLLEIKRRGRILDVGEAENLSNFTVEFTPAEEVLKAAENVIVNAVLSVEKTPELNSVTDLRRKSSDGMITAGEPVSVKGKNLKLDEDTDEIWFIPQNDDGTDSNDNSKRVVLDNDNLFRNKPTELNFFVPDSLDKDTKYKIELRIFTPAKMNESGEIDAEKQIKLTARSKIFEVA